MSNPGERRPDPRLYLAPQYVRDRLQNSRGGRVSAADLQAWRLQHERLQRQQPATPQQQQQQQEEQPATQQQQQQQPATPQQQQQQQEEQSATQQQQQQQAASQQQLGQEQPPQRLPSFEVFQNVTASASRPLPEFQVLPQFLNNPPRVATPAPVLNAPPMPSTSTAYNPTAHPSQNLIDNTHQNPYYQLPPSSYYANSQNTYDNPSSSNSSLHNQQYPQQNFTKNSYYSYDNPPSNNPSLYCPKQQSFNSAQQNFSNAPTARPFPTDFHNNNPNFNYHPQCNVPPNHQGIFPSVYCPFQSKALPNPTGALGSTNGVSAPSYLPTVPRTRHFQSPQSGLNSLSRQYAADMPVVPVVPASLAMMHASMQASLQAQQTYAQMALNSMMVSSLFPMMTHNDQISMMTNIVRNASESLHNATMNSLEMFAQINNLSNQSRPPPLIVELEDEPVEQPDPPAQCHADEQSPEMQVRSDSASTNTSTAAAVAYAAAAAANVAATAAANAALERGDGAGRGRARRGRPPAAAAAAAGTAARGRRTRRNGGDQLPYDVPAASVQARNEAYRRAEEDYILRYQAKVQQEAYLRQQREALLREQQTELELKILQELQAQKPQKDLQPQEALQLKQTLQKLQAQQTLSVQNTLQDKQALIDQEAMLRKAASAVQESADQQQAPSSHQYVHNVTNGENLVTRGQSLPLLTESDIQGQLQPQAALSQSEAHARAWAEVLYNKAALKNQSQANAETQETSGTLSQNDLLAEISARAALRAQSQNRDDTHVASPQQHVHAYSLAVARDVAGGNAMSQASNAQERATSRSATNNAIADLVMMKNNPTTSQILPETTKETQSRVQALEPARAEAERLRQLEAERAENLSLEMRLRRGDGARASVVQHTPPRQTRPPPVPVVRIVEPPSRSQSVAKGVSSTISMLRMRQGLNISVVPVPTPSPEPPQPETTGRTTPLPAPSQPEASGRTTPLPAALQPEASGRTTPLPAAAAAVSPPEQETLFRMPAERKRRRK